MEFTGIGDSIAVSEWDSKTSGSRRLDFYLKESEIRIQVFGEKTSSSNHRFVACEGKLLEGCRLYSDVEYCSINHKVELITCKCCSSKPL